MQPGKECNPEKNATQPRWANTHSLIPLPHRQDDLHPAAGGLIKPDDYFVEPPLRRNRNTSTAVYFPVLRRQDDLYSAAGACSSRT